MHFLLKIRISYVVTSKMNLQNRIYRKKQNTITAKNKALKLRRVYIQRQWGLK